MKLVSPMRRPIFNRGTVLGKTEISQYEPQVCVVPSLVYVEPHDDIDHLSSLAFAEWLLYFLH